MEVLGSGMGFLGWDGGLLRFLVLGRLKVRFKGEVDGGEAVVG